MRRSWAHPRLQWTSSPTSAGQSARGKNRWQRRTAVQQRWHLRPDDGLERSGRSSRRRAAAASRARARGGAPGAWSDWSWWRRSLQLESKDGVCGWAGRGVSSIGSAASVVVVVGLASGRAEDASTRTRPPSHIDLKRPRRRATAHTHPSEVHLILLRLPKRRWSEVRSSPVTPADGELDRLAYRRPSPPAAGDMAARTRAVPFPGVVRLWSPSGPSSH